jgi:hypothetical protein
LSKIIDTEFILVKIADERIKNKLKILINRSTVQMAEEYNPFIERKEDNDFRSPSEFDYSSNSNNNKNNLIEIMNKNETLIKTNELLKSEIEQLKILEEKNKIEFEEIVKRRSEDRTAKYKIAVDRLSKYLEDSRKENLELRLKERELLKVNDNQNELIVELKKQVGKSEAEQIKELKAKNAKLIEKVIALENVKKSTRIRNIETPVNFELISNKGKVTIDDFDILEGDEEVVENTNNVNIELVQKTLNEYEEKLKCIQCLINERNCVLNCGHVVLCMNCFNKNSDVLGALKKKRKTFNTCPICKLSTTQAKQIFFS